MNTGTDGLKAAARQALPGGTHVISVLAGPAKGCRILFNFQSDSFRVILGLYEVELNSYIRRLCQPGKAVFDIGGQIGLEALMFAQLSGSQVLSVDADADCCETIASNAGLNGSIGSLISVREAFIGDGNSGVALDSLVRDTFVPGFVKLDIEGYEAEALRGADELLSEHRPALLIEVHGQDVEDECVDVLREHRYHLSTVNPRTWLPDFRPMVGNRWLIAEPSN
jgi:hypothetical protein